MGKKAVVLSGGGAKGGYQIGVWKVLRQMGFTPDIVVGTSVGALNGALMALDNFDAALDIWENMSMDSVFQNFVNMSDEENPDRESYIKELAKEAIFKGGADYTPLQERVKSLMDEEKLRTSPIRFGLVTTMFPKIKPVEVFIEDIPEGKAADYVLASAAAFPFMKSSANPLSSTADIRTTCRSKWLSKRVRTTLWLSTSAKTQAQSSARRTMSRSNISAARSRSTMFSAAC